MTQIPQEGSVLDRADPRILSYAFQGAIGSSGERQVLLVPTEDVLILALDLPLANLRQRAAALPFAVEDYLSEPISAVHVAMGREIGPRRHLAGIVRHDVMRDWCRHIATGGSIVPDVLVLPVPQEGWWSVSLRSGRVLVRCPDATGFAVADTLFANAWKAGQSPALDVFGDAPTGFDGSETRPYTAAVMEAELRAPVLDLRQGLYAVRADGGSKIAQRAGWILAAGALLHTIVLALDLSAVNAIADRKEEEARTLLHSLAPSAPAHGDVVADLNALLNGGSTATGPQFLPMFARAAQALQPFAAEISTQSLVFSRADGTLTMSIEGSTLATLQSVEQALKSAGLDTVSGPATAANGAAQFRITIRQAA